MTSLKDKEYIQGIRFSNDEKVRRFKYEDVAQAVNEDDENLLALIGSINGLFYDGDNAKQKRINQLLAEYQSSKKEIFGNFGEEEE